MSKLIGWKIAAIVWVGSSKIEERELLPTGKWRLDLITGEIWIEATYFTPVLWFFKIRKTKMFHENRIVFYQIFKCGEE